MALHDHLNSLVALHIRLFFNSTLNTCSGRPHVLNQCRVVCGWPVYTLSPAWSEIHNMWKWICWICLYLLNPILFKNWACILLVFFSFHFSSNPFFSLYFTNVLVFGSLGFFCCVLFFTTYYLRSIVLDIGIKHKILSFLGDYIPRNYIVDFSC